MNTKHTRGALRAAKIINGSEALVCHQTPHWLPDGSDLAAIIDRETAAPEMLAALKNLVDDALANGMHSSEPRIIEARQAIARAEGVEK